MAEISSENRLKYKNYKEQFKRLNRALANGFNLEAMFIEYAILEDRVESVLRHAELWDSYLKHCKGRNPTIDSKIKYLKKAAENKKSLLHRYFSDDLLDRLLAWKEERNRLIHALLKQHLENGELSTLATQGNDLTKTLRARVSACNRALEKAKL